MMFISSSAVRKRFSVCRKLLSMYEKASSAQCVEAKSEAPLLGVWRAQAVPCLPGGFKEGSESVGSKGVKEKSVSGCLSENVC